MVDPSILGITWKRQLWHKWKSLRKVPFRKSWFVGYDLEGNSYWELIDHNNPSRLRRKVSLDRPYFHFSDFKPHPMWMQWLQFTRPRAPTLLDLTNDAKRQYQLKLLAKQADEKWKTVPLRSGQRQDGNDPRIGSAWSGNPVNMGEASIDYSDVSNAAAHPENHIDSHTEDVNNPLSIEEMKIREAMRNAETRRKKGPKYVRDELGQVKRQQEDEKHESANLQPKSRS